MPYEKDVSLFKSLLQDTLRFVPKGGQNLHVNLTDLLPTVQGFDFQTMNLYTLDRTQIKLCRID